MAAAEVLALPAAAEMPMSPIYPTTNRPKRVPTPAQSAAVVAPSAAEKTPAAAAPSETKAAAVTPARDAAATPPVFEAAIPPPAASDNQPASSPVAEKTPPGAKKTAAKPRQRRPARAPRYAYSPYPYYRVAPTWSGDYADPRRGWGGGRYGPSPISDGQ
jgi:hypothetical protein